MMGRNTSNNLLKGTTKHQALKNMCYFFLHLRYAFILMVSLFDLHLICWATFRLGNHCPLYGKTAIMISLEQKPVPTKQRTQRSRRGRISAGKGQQRLCQLPPNYHETRQTAIRRGHQAVGRAARGLLGLTLRQVVKVTQKCTRYVTLVINAIQCNCESGQWLPSMLYFMTFKPEKNIETLNVPQGTIEETYL